MTDNETIVTGATVVDYIDEIRYALDHNDHDVAHILLDLLYDIACPGSIEWQTMDNEDDDDDGDILDSDVCNDHCDYCGADGVETFGIMDSETMACDPCLRTHSDLVWVYN